MSSLLTVKLATIVAVDPSDLYSQIIAPPLITNEAVSSSAMSVIARRESWKYTDLFGYAWQQHSSSMGLNGPALSMQSVPVNVADLGKPPPPLSWYYGAAGWYCLNENPYAIHGQPISAGLPPISCDTIYDDYYRPWIQIPETLRTVQWGSCHPMFGWDPPIALTRASVAAGPTTPGAALATTTNDGAIPSSLPAGPGPGETATTPTAEPVKEPQGYYNTGKDEPTSSVKSLSPSSPSTQEPQSALEDSSPAEGDGNRDGSVNDEHAADNDGHAGSSQTGSQGESNSQDNSSEDNTITKATSDAGHDSVPAAASRTGSIDSKAPIATIGSGSAVVTIIPDPSDRKNVVISADGSATTISAGRDPIIGNQRLLVDRSGNFAFMATSTVESIVPGRVTTAADGRIFSAAPGGVAVDGHLVSAGASATTISGAAYSIDSSGQLVVKGSTTLIRNVRVEGTTDLDKLLGAVMSEATVISQKSTAVDQISSADHASETGYSSAGPITQTGSNEAGLVTSSRLILCGILLLYAYLST